MFFVIQVYQIRKLTKSTLITAGTLQTWALSLERNVVAGGTNVVLAGTKM